MDKFRQKKFHNNIKEYAFFNLRTFLSEIVVNYSGLLT